MTDWHATGGRVAHRYADDTTSLTLCGRTERVCAPAPDDMRRCRACERAVERERP